MASLCAKRSRTSLFECFSSMVRDVSVRGRRMHGARVAVSAVMYDSSADVRSMRRVKWFMQASRVAMLVSRSCESVCWSTAIRVASVESGAEVV